MPDTESGLTYPALSNAPNGPAQIQELAQDVTSLYPRGRLGYAPKTASQLAIPTTVTDLTSLSIAVTVGTSRRIRISAFCQFNHDNSNWVALLIRESSTTLATSQNNAGAGEYRSHALSVVLTPSSGSHTYKLSAQCSVGTAALIASSTQPAYILVEDIGAA